MCLARVRSSDLVGSPLLGQGKSSARDDIEGELSISAQLRITCIWSDSRSCERRGRPQRG